MNGKMLNTKCLVRFYYTLFFAYIQDRINLLRVGRIQFDICYIRYYALFASVNSYFLKENV